jgi:hypothetical protein
MRLLARRPTCARPLLLVSAAFGSDETGVAQLCCSAQEESDTKITRGPQVCFYGNGRADRVIVG